jgi:hypothetical protein
MRILEVEAAIAAAITMGLGHSVAGSCLPGAA